MRGRYDLEHALLAHGGERIAIVLERPLEGLEHLPIRMARGQCLHPVEGEERLDIIGLLGPQRAVIVEGGDALGHRHEIGSAGGGDPHHEVEDHPLAGPSFHDGSESACATAGAAGNKPAAARPATNDLRCMPTPCGSNPSMKSRRSTPFASASMHVQTDGDVLAPRSAHGRSRQPVASHPSCTESADFEFLDTLFGACEQEPFRPAF